MKKILIILTSDSELISYEAVSLACTLATFDHTVSILFADKSKTVLTDKTSRTYGMVQSFELYDIHQAWHDFDCVSELNETINQVLTKKPDEMSADDYDVVFEF